MMWGGRRRKLSTEEIAFNAAARAKRQAAVMHCQCCSRDILANTGTIAHHGYERPGHGWQTNSCMGAKRLPFEADRAALGEMISFLCLRLKGQRVHRKEIDEEKTPIVFDYSQQFIGPPFRYDWFSQNRWNRPDWPSVKMSFLVTKKTWKKFVDGVGRDSTYGIFDFSEYKKRHLDYLDCQIEDLVSHIRSEQARHDGWRQTHEWKNKKWRKL